MANTNVSKDNNMQARLEKEPLKIYIPIAKELKYEKMFKSLHCNYLLLEKFCCKLKKKMELIISFFQRDK